MTRALHRQSAAPSARLVDVQTTITRLFSFTESDAWVVAAEKERWALDVATYLTDATEALALAGSRAAWLDQVIQRKPADPSGASADEIMCLRYREIKAAGGGGDAVDSAAARRLVAAETHGRALLNVDAPAVQAALTAIEAGIWPPPGFATPPAPPNPPPLSLGELAAQHEARTTKTPKASRRPAKKAAA